MRLCVNLALMFAFLLGCTRTPPVTSTPPSTPTVISVAAASDLKFAFDEIVTEFQQQNPQIQVKSTYGSSGTMFAQLSNKAPFDIFLSADINFPRKLMEQGHAVAETEFQYAIGHIVLWLPKESPLEPEKFGIEVLNNAKVQKIAIANPKTAPYGRAAEAALKQLGIYESIKDRLVIGENVAQAAQFVESGAADVGIIALSLAMAPPLRDKGRYWSFPEDSYPKLEQGGIVLSWAKDRTACEQLRLYLLSEPARVILRRYGFVMPGE